MLVVFQAHRHTSIVEDFVSWIKQNNGDLSEKISIQTIPYYGRAIMAIDDIDVCTSSSKTIIYIRLSSLMFVVLALAMYPTHIQTIQEGELLTKVPIFIMMTGKAAMESDISHVLHDIRAAATNQQGT